MKRKTDSNKDTNPVYAALYLRTSQDDRDDPRLSTGSQKADGLELAKKLGFTVREENIFVDLDLSGSLPPTRWQTKKLTKRNHRGDLEALMQSIESGKVTALIIRKRDRLFRRLEDSLRFFYFLDDHKIQLHATAETIKHDGSASSKLELRMAMAVAEYMLDSAKENTLQAKRRQKAEGRKMSCCLTLGYRNGQKKGTVETVKEAIPVVKEVFKRYLAGQSRGEIVRWLNTNHKDLLPTRGKRYEAKQWYHSHIARILSNPHYIGMTVGSDETLIPSQAYPAILGTEIWYKAQQAKKVRRNPLHGRKVADHLLSGMLTCGYCRSHLVVYSRYHKTEKRRVGFEYKCPNHHPTNQAPFTMREMLWDKWADLVFASNPIEEVGGEPAEVIQYKIELDDLRRNLDDIDTRFTTGKIGFERMEALRPPLIANIDRLKRLIESAQASYGTDTILRTWNSLTLEEQRVIIGTLVESILVYHDHAVTIRGDRIRIYPLQHIHLDKYPSVRPFNSLLPARFNGLEYLDGTYEGRPCTTVIWGTSKEPNSQRAKGQNAKNKKNTRRPI